MIKTPQKKVVKKFLLSEHKITVMSPPATRRRRTRTPEPSGGSSPPVSERKALLKECADLGVPVSTKDSAKRLRAKLERRRQSDASLEETVTDKKSEAADEEQKATDEEQKAVIAADDDGSKSRPEDKEEAPVVVPRKGKFLLLLFVPLILFLLWPATTTKKNETFAAIGVERTMRAVKETTTSEDTLEQVFGFLRSWESPRRKNAASLLLVGTDASAVLAALYAAEADILADDDPQRIKHFLRMTRSRSKNALIVDELFISKEDGGKTTTSSSNNKKNPANVEHLIDPYFKLEIHPDVGVSIDRSAFVYVLSIPCSTSTDDPRALLRSSFPDDEIPPAFVNRIQYAALAC